MFDYIQIGIIIIIVSALIIISYGIIYYLYAIPKRNYVVRDVGSMISIVACGVIIISFIFTLCIACDMWDKVNYLPFEYQSADKTVKEIKELLTNDNASIGDGLESLQLKQSIKDAIERKNDLRADILSWLYNPLMPYKQEMLERLSPDFFEYA